jgi:hypothetical protein
MSEVEAFGLLDLAADPLAEVGVVDLPLLLVVLVNDELGQVLEVELLVLPAEEAQDVVHRHIAVIVGVQVEEGLAHTHPVVGKLIFYQLFQLEETICDRFMALRDRP